MTNIQFVMFGIFGRKRTLLREHLEDFYDIHSHLLWGVDDGCRDAEHTLALDAELAELGFKGAYLTPHIIYGLYGNNTEERLRKRFQEMPEGMKLEVRLAAEYNLDERFMEHVEAADNMLTMGDNHLLVEFGLGTSRVGSHLNDLFEAAIRGKNIIIAHPERYAFLAEERNYHELEKLTSKGYKLQLNLLSLAGLHGDKAKRVAEEMLLSGKYTFVGSDTHSHIYIKALREATISSKVVEPLRALMENNKRLFGLTYKV